MSRRLVGHAVGGFTAIALFLVMTKVAFTATPSADQALKLQPIQKDVDYDRPTPEEAAKCKIQAKKASGNVGWVVEGPDGSILRKFVDTNGDNVVDQWSYYKDGLEVYRDIDSNGNGKADQYRWFNTAGTRWGLDKDEDGTIDSWKVISPEEVTAEAVAAIANRDNARFLRLCLTRDEAKKLGLDTTREEQLVEKIKRLPSDYEKAVAEQKLAGPGTKWIQFSGSQPGIVPAGTDGSTSDIWAYENVLAVVSTEGKHSQIQLGTLVKVGDAWKAIDSPHAVAEGQADLASTGFFFHSTAKPSRTNAAGNLSDSMQKLLADLEKLDKTATEAVTPEQRATFNGKRADLLEGIADQAKSPEEREMWMRQLADMISAAVQNGTYPQGAKRLEGLFDKLSRDPSQKNLVAYVRFRQLMADYGLKLQTPGSDFPKLQAEWFKQLEQYVSEYPKAADSSEAMLQLAMNSEFAGQEDDAKKWYGRITQQFADSPAGRKAAGAMTRLDLVGKPINLQGKAPGGETVDVARFRGSVVLVQFWATWCEPCKADIAVLKDLTEKYGRQFNVVGVSLDDKSKELTEYLRENRLPWPQIYEEGGLDSRPANELGVMTVPTMILVDQRGNVVSRAIRAADIEKELKRLIK